MSNLMPKAFKGNLILARTWVQEVLTPNSQVEPVGRTAISTALCCAPVSSSERRYHLTRRMRRLRLRASVLPEPLQQLGRS